MSTTAPPYRFHEFEIPRQPPFDQDACRWTTFVGEFAAVILRDPDVKYCWFVNEGPHYQLCFASAKFQDVETRMEALKKKVDIVSKNKPGNDTVDSAFGGDRWIAKPRGTDPLIANARSELVLRVMHAVCELYADQLVKSGAYWTLEKNDCDQNPLGNSFESLQHLIAQISGAEFDVELSLIGRTAWMRPPYPNLKVRCHL